MKPRHRAQARLARHVPGLSEPSDRLPVRRLAEREEEVREARAMPGASVRIPEEVRVKPLRTVRDVIHAPLLMRLVRHPYALAAGRARRTTDISRSRPSVLDREPLPHAAAEWAAIRASRRVGQPMRDLQHRPDVRPHPFERVREREELDEPVHFDPQAEEGWL